MKRRLGTLLVAVAGLGAGSVRAQSYSDPGLGIGGHVAYSKASGAAGSAVAGGAHVRFRLTGGLGAEVLATWRREEYASPSGETLLRVVEVPVQLSLQLFFLSSTPVQPYVLAGAGYYWVHTAGAGANEAAGTHIENKVGLHAGGGVDVRVARRLGVFADVRYVFLDVDAVKALDLGARSNFLHGTAGLTVYF